MANNRHKSKCILENHRYRPTCTQKCILFCNVTVLVIYLNGFGIF